MALVSISGQMEESIAENGKTITCMAKESIHGKMVGNMKGNTSMTGSTDLASIFGQMVGNIVEDGKTVSNMVKEYTNRQMAQKEEAYGKMEKELNG